MSDSDSIYHLHRRTEEYMQLFVKNQRRIYGFIFSLVPHEADADDLVQETCTALWRKFDEFTPDSDFGAWALKIARYEVLRYRRRQHARQRRFSNEAVESLADALVKLGETPDRRREALSDCLKSLSSSDQELVRRRYEEGVTTKDVAESANRSVFTIYKALNRIHRSLLDCIKRTMAAEVRPSQ